MPIDTVLEVALGAFFYPYNNQIYGGLNPDPGCGTVTTAVPGTVNLILSPTGTASFSGVIKDGVGHIAVIIDGPGIQFLSGSNTYTGGTTINGGILVASNGANGSATGSGSVILNGGTLASGAGGGSIPGDVEIGSVASEIAPGGSGSIGSLTIGSLLAASGLTTLDFDLTTPGGSGNLLVVANGLTLAPDTAITFDTDPTTPGDYRLIGYGSLTGSLSDFDLPTAPPGLTYSLSTTVDPGYIDLVVAVPEPSTLVLLGVAPLPCWSAFRGGVKGRRHEDSSVSDVADIPPHPPLACNLLDSVVATR